MCFGGGSTKAPPAPNPSHYEFQSDITGSNANTRRSLYSSDNAWEGGQYQMNGQASPSAVPTPSPTGGQ